jgi:hypothetical protein
VVAEASPTESGPRSDDGGRLKARGSWLVREHPGLVVSAAYFSATAVGMLSSVAFYRSFGINVFHFAQISDFVLAAIRNPVASLAVLLAGPMVWFIVVTDDWLDRRFRRYRYLYGPAWLRRWSRSAPALVLYFLIYAWSFATMYSARLHGEVQAGDWPVAEVQLQSGTYLGRDATRPFEATLLGSTGSSIFLFDRASGTATVVPLENLGSITVR